MQEAKHNMRTKDSEIIQGLKVQPTQDKDWEKHGGLWHI